MINISPCMYNWLWIPPSGYIYKTSHLEMGATTIVKSTGGFERVPSGIDDFNGYCTNGHISFNKWQINVIKATILEIMD